jgi:hypothetical protein
MEYGYQSSPRNDVGCKRRQANSSEGFQPSLTCTGTRSDHQNTGVNRNSHPEDWEPDVNAGSVITAFSDNGNRVQKKFGQSLNVVVRNVNENRI